MDGAIGTLFIDIDGVENHIAEQVNEAFYEDDGDLVLGTIRWSSGGEDKEVGILVYAVAVRGC